MTPPYGDPGRIGPLRRRRGRRVGWIVVLALSASCRPVPPEGPGTSERPAAIARPSAERGADQPSTITWDQAADFLGQHVILVGPVVSAGKSARGHVYLRFPRDPRAGQVTAFVRNSVARKFPVPPETALAGKTIRVRGELYLFQGELNIAIESPEAVSILADGAPLPAAATQPPPARRVVGDVITLATFNVLNLLDDFDDPYTRDETTHSGSRADRAQLAATIRQLNADVLALQEVENRGVLEQFNRVLLAELDYRHVVHFEGNDARGVDVALLSRIPVGPVTSYRHLAFPDEQGVPRTLRRDLLRVRLQPKSGVEFDIFVVHLKSAAGSDPDSDVLRLAEARLTRSVLDELLRNDPRALFVVAGDFNSAFDSAMVQAVLGSGATALVSFVDELAPDERITYNRPPYEGMIDFLFASPAMARRYVPRSFRILPGSAAAGGSDHNPVAASFRVR